MAVPRHAYEALTFEQYAALDAAGKITRPLTDPPIGATTAARRVADAIASEVVTDHHPVRTFCDDCHRRKAWLTKRRGGRP